MATLFAPSIFGSMLEPSRGELSITSYVLPYEMATAPALRKAVYKLE
jgi:hypothetical protein